RARAAAMDADDDAFEDLDALFVALPDLHVHLDGVARLHRRPLRQLRLLDQLNRAHHCLLQSCRAVIPAIPAVSVSLLRPKPPRPIGPDGAPAFVPALPVSAIAESRRGCPTAARRARGDLRSPAAA